MCACLLLLPFYGWLPAQEAMPEHSISFNRDIRPILSDNCFPCHGPDAESRQAELRLDLPGHGVEEEVLARVAAADPQLRMPPPESNKRLNEEQIARLRRWVEAGAAYQSHWAFAPLTQPSVPHDLLSGAINPIDAFVAARLAEHDLPPAAEAAPEILLRRVTLDLTGLPPTLEDWTAFELDRQRFPPTAAYELAVDRLLASPHFGEHLAVGWLDAARYADTNGYFGDKPRQMWLWRDWVIDAFNANIPFDQFTIEQLAGDLLPGATIRQKIATGFNRNHMANNETGIIDEEFRVEYVVDRVHTTMTTWLGLTAGCAQCHDHKFDPISQREFYQLFAFFNNVPETGLIHDDNPPPRIEVPSDQQRRRLQESREELQQARAAFQPFQERVHAAIAEWERRVSPQLSTPPEADLRLHATLDDPLPASFRVAGTLQHEQGIDGLACRFDGTQHVEVATDQVDLDQPWTLGVWLKPDGTLSCPLSCIEPTGERRGVEVILGKGVLKVLLVQSWGVHVLEVATLDEIPARQWHHLVISYDGSRSHEGLKVYLNGELAELEVRQDTLEGSIQNNEPWRIGRRDSGLGYYGLLDDVRVLQAACGAEIVREWYEGQRIRNILSTAQPERSSAEQAELFKYYLRQSPNAEVTAAQRRVRLAEEAEANVRASIPTVLVMEEMATPRTTHVLHRGQYDQLREVVEPAVPNAIGRWPKDAPANRIGLASWLVAPDNPLTARVAANRLWQHCFGQGLVRTVDDFGSQGTPPTHPELLDWLAVSLRDHAWDVKRLLRLIVTSRTYRQQSAVTARAAFEVDPSNRLLARGPRARLSAEMLRDQALLAAGLLVPKLGGPSVRPYQPPGIWEDVSYNGDDRYQATAGEGAWRRSVYTYVKRQAPPPSLLTFDGPTREKCVLQREASNTPLQALLLLNDVTFVEASRSLAQHALEMQGDDADRIAHLWNRILLRKADLDEIGLLLGQLERQRHRFQDAPDQARQFLSVGRLKVASKHAETELAAWSVIALTMLNLDEAITKR